MKKNNGIDKLFRKSQYCCHLEVVENNPKMQKRANKLARKARDMARKSDAFRED